MVAAWPNCGGGAENFSYSLRLREAMAIAVVKNTKSNILEDVTTHNNL